MRGGGNSALAQSLPPPQIQALRGIPPTEFPEGATGLVGTYKMCNNGASPVHWLMAQFQGQGWGPTYKAFVFKRELSGQAAFLPLSVFEDTTLSEALCGNYGGYIGGRLDRNADEPITPTWWLDSGVHHQVTQGNDLGQFSDVNQHNYFVGYFEGASGKHGFWYLAPDVNILSETFPYTGSEARAINVDRDIVGQAFGPGLPPPVMWRHTGGGNYTLINLSAQEGWPPGRFGYCTGITDRKAGDPNGPYVVGYMEPGEGQPGQPFIYSAGLTSGPRFRFLGTQYGISAQISDRDYSDPNDPVISFVGGTPFPLIWIGSPSPTAQNNGCANDLWAYLDASARDTAIPPQQATGLNSEFVFGGSRTGSQGPALYVSQPSTWHGLLGTHTATLTKGILQGGSMSSLAAVDGKYVNVLNGPAFFPGEPEIVIQVDEVLQNAAPLLDALAFRVTARASAATNLTLYLDLWEWTLGQWTPTASSPMAGEMTTAFVTLYGQNGQPILGNYFNPGTGAVAIRARIRVARTGQYAKVWTCDFEQGVFMVEDHGS